MRPFVINKFKMEKKIKNKKNVTKSDLLNQARAAFNEDISNEELVNNPLYDIMDDEEIFSDLFIEDFIIE